MRVYVESNFVLEIVLEQEQCGACEQLVHLASVGSIELVLPAFALLEPYQTIVRRRTDGKSLQDGLSNSARQMERTASTAADASRLRDSVNILLRAEQEASNRFLQIRSRLLDVARVVSLDGQSLRDASTLAMQLDLTLPDAVMLACVLADAQHQPSPSIFLNRNSRDFDDPDVKTRLKQMGCDLIWRFDDGLARVTSALAKPGATH